MHKKGEKMKKIIFAIVFTFLSALSVQAQFVSASVGVDGLTCSMCAKGTEETLRQLPFIDDVKIDLNKLVASITFKKGVHVEIDKLKEMIYDAGFTTRSLEVVFNFDTAFTVENDAHFVYDGATYHFIGVKDNKLSGPVTLRFIDKPYVSKREFAQLAKKTHFGCYQNGSMSDDCPLHHKVVGNLYHVTLL